MPESRTELLFDKTIEKLDNEVFLLENYFTPIASKL